MLLRITDGTTTITLNNDGGSVSTGLIGARYFPSAGDGETATETITIAYGGQSSDVLATIGTIKRLLSDARIRQVETGNARVYLEYQVNSSDSVYRSEITDGRDDWGDSKQKRQLYGITGAGELALIVVRRDFWEGASTQLASTTIRNGNTSPYNAITLATIPGNLPTPLSLSIANASGAALNARNFYVNIDAFAGMTTNQHLLTPPTTTYNWTGSSAHNSLAFVMSLSSVIQKLAGKTINVLAAFSSISGGAYVRAGLYMLYGGVYILQNASHEQYTNSGILLYDLGSLSIPKLATGGLVLVVTVYSSTSGSATMLFSQVAPAANAMMLESSFIYNVGDAITYDAVEDMSGFTSGGVTYPFVHKSGGVGLVYPGRTNRLHLLFDESSSFNTSRQLTVTATCRPRRQTI